MFGCHSPFEPLWLHLVSGSASCQEVDLPLICCYSLHRMMPGGVSPSPQTLPPRVSPPLPHLSPARFPKIVPSYLLLPLNSPATQAKVGTPEVWVVSHACSLWEAQRPVSWRWLKSWMCAGQALVQENPEALELFSVFLRVPEK